MRNSDEIFLKQQKIDASASLSVPAQALRIAIFDAFRSYEFYLDNISRLGAYEPFLQLLQSERSHIERLAQLCKHYETPLPLNTWKKCMPKTKNYKEACLVALEYEAKVICMYDELLKYVFSFDDIEALFFDLQAEAFLEHLEVLKEAVKKDVHCESFTKMMAQAL